MHDENRVYLACQSSDWIRKGHLDGSIKFLQERDEGLEWVSWRWEAGASLSPSWPTTCSTWRSTPSWSSSSPPRSPGSPSLSKACPQISRLKTNLALFRLPKRRLSTIIIANNYYFHSHYHCIRIFWSHHHSLFIFLNNISTYIHRGGTYQLSIGPRLSWGSKLWAKAIFFTFGMDVRNIFRQ